MEDEIHLFWKCPKGRSDRNGLSIHTLANAVISLGVPVSDPIFTHRLLVPTRWLQPPPDLLARLEGATAPGIPPETAGLVFTDGGADHPNDPRLRRAAFGLRCPATGYWEGVRQWASKRLCLRRSLLPGGPPSYRPSLCA